MNYVILIHLIQNDSQMGLSVIVFTFRFFYWAFFFIFRIVEFRLVSGGGVQLGHVGPEFASLCGEQVLERVRVHTVILSKKCKSLCHY